MRYLTKSGRAVVILFVACVLFFGQTSSAKASTLCAGVSNSNIFTYTIDLDAQICHPEDNHQVENRIKLQIVPWFGAEGVIFTQILISHSQSTMPESAVTCNDTTPFASAIIELRFGGLIETVTCNINYTTPGGISVTHDFTLNMDRKSFTPLTIAASNVVFGAEIENPRALLTGLGNWVDLDGDSISVFFSENVTGFSLSDLTLTNVTASNLQGSGNAYTFDIDPITDGDISIGLPANRVVNVGGKGNLASETLTSQGVVTAPSVSFLGYFDAIFPISGHPNAIISLVALRLPLPIASVATSAAIEMEWINSLDVTLT